jgi:hypothetical protein
LGRELGTHYNLNNNQFPTWPGFTAKAVKQYLPESSPAIDKGHMKRQKQDIRSTKEKLHNKLEQIETARDMHPPQEGKKRITCSTKVAPSTLNMVPSTSILQENYPSARSMA